LQECTDSGHIYLEQLKLNRIGLVLVAHACNPCYSGGRDQEDPGSKPAPAISLLHSISQKNPPQKRAGGVAQGVGPEFIPPILPEMIDRWTDRWIVG
jgi:hypothetical protein